MPQFRRLLAPLALSAVLATSGCSTISNMTGGCGAYLAGGALAGAGIGNVAGRAATGNRNARVATTVAGGLAGMAAGYAMCQRAHAQERDLAARFDALEAQFAAAPATTPDPADAGGQADGPAPLSFYTSGPDAEGNVPGGGLVHMEVVQDRMVLLQISSQLAFESGGTTLSPRARLVIGAVAESLTEQPTNRAVVLGYTDDTGAADANLRLSQRRAEAVGGRIVQSGVDGSRVTTEGRGEADPVATGTSAAARARNRRVEVWLVPTAG